jgi:acyl-ACP thioesterase
VSRFPIGDGRRVRLDQRVRLGDVTPRSRLRLDAAARYLQDVATDDGDDAALPAGRGWILRRLGLTIDRLPRLSEDLVLETRCTGLGIGARWAERTTTVADSGGTGLLTGRAVWVYVDLVTGAPAALPPEFFAVYGDGPRDHRVSARLSLPKLDASARRSAWALRRSDIDVFGHVNNANYWIPVEEWLGGPGAGRRITAAEIEFGQGIAPDDACELAIDDAGDQVTIWFLVGDDTRATAQVHFAVA